MEKQVQDIIGDLLHRAGPKPEVDISMCEKCGKMTDNWISHWPKSRLIVWRCKECARTQAMKEREDLENILEKMCDETRKK